MVGVSADTLKFLSVSVPQRPAFATSLACVCWCDIGNLYSLFLGLEEQDHMLYVGPAAAIEIMPIFGCVETISN
jgi:hypothetical protein